jgi:hypothetical protein
MTCCWPSGCGFDARPEAAAHYRTHDFRQRLTFLNRTLFAGVPIPPLEVEIAA